MASGFGSGAVDDADGSLQARRAELVRGGIPGIHPHHEVTRTGVVQQCFDAGQQCGTDRFVDGGAAPFLCGGNRPVEGIQPIVRRCAP